MSLAPSYRYGYAAPVSSWWPYATHPELWRGCVLSLCPSLGKSGFTVFDVSGFGRHGTLTNDTPANAWKRDSLEFDDTDSFIDVPGTLPSEGAWSIWFRHNDTPSNDVLLSTTQWEHRGATTSSTRIGTNGLQDYTWSVDTTSFHHLAMNFTTDKQPTAAYLDGQLLTPGSNTDAVNPNQENLNIGARNGSGALSFNGRFNDLMIFRRPLSVPEVRLLSTRPGIAYEFDDPFVGRAPAAPPAATSSQLTLLGVG